METNNSVTVLTVSTHLHTDLNLSVGLAFKVKISIMFLKPTTKMPYSPRNIRDKGSKNSPLPIKWDYLVVS